MRSSYSYSCLKTLGTKFPVFARYIDEITYKLKIHATIDHTNKEEVSTKREMDSSSATSTVPVIPNQQI